MFPDFKNSHYPLIPYHNLDLVCYLSEHPQIQNSMSHTVLINYSTLKIKATTAPSKTMVTIY